MRGRVSNNRTHGMTNTSIYNVWSCIKYRCSDSSKHKEHLNYGGRGITMCHEWKNNFITFRDWVLSNCYQDRLTIDRINNDGDYAPDNCRFITRADNAKRKCRGAT